MFEFMKVFTYLIVLCVLSEDKQRSPYALNTAGDTPDDQDGDSRYCDIQSLYDIQIMYEIDQ